MTTRDYKQYFKEVALDEAINAQERFEDAMYIGATIAIVCAAPFLSELVDYCIYQLKKKCWIEGCNNRLENRGGKMECPEHGPNRRSMPAWLLAPTAIWLAALAWWMV